MIDLYGFCVKFTILFLVVFALGRLFYTWCFRNMVLVIYLLFAAYINLIVHLFETGNLRQPYLLLTNTPFLLSLGPLAYLFVLSLAEGRDVMKKKDWLHFIPAFLSLFVILALLILHPGVIKFYKAKNFLTGPHFHRPPIIIATMIFFMSYILLSIKKVWSAFQKKDLFHRRFIFLLVSLLICVMLIIFKIVAMLTSSLEFYRISNILYMINMTFMFFIIQKYSSFFFYKAISLSTKQKGKSYLSNIDKENLEKKLHRLMEEERFYCDEDLTLKRLSAALEVTPHQLSEFLNSRYGKNFNVYVNTFRVEESKRLLADGKTNALSIAYAVGFNSYSTFYIVFKNETGLSPADFRKKNLL